MKTMACGAGERSAARRIESRGWESCWGNEGSTLGSVFGEACTDDRAELGAKLSQPDFCRLSVVCFGAVKVRIATAIVFRITTIF